VLRIGGIRLGKLVGKTEKCEKGKLEKNKSQNK